MMVSCVPTKIDGDDTKWQMKSLEDHAATAAAVQVSQILLAYSSAHLFSTARRLSIAFVVVSYMFAEFSGH